MSTSATEPGALVPLHDDRGATMVRRFGVLGSPVAWLLSRVRIEAHGVEPILEAARQGRVVYVLPRRSALDHLTLNVVLNGRRLPLSAWARGVGGSWYLPFLDGVKALWRRMTGRNDEVADGTLAAHVRQGRPVVLFLDDPGPTDPFEALADIEEPLHFVPLMVVWDKGPEVRLALRHFFIGRRDEPGWLGRLVQLAWHRNEAFVHVGRPVDLASVRERFEAGRRGSALRKLLHRALSTETKVVRGPRLMPHDQMKRLVLDVPPMRQLAEDVAVRRGIATERVVAEMERHYDRIAARFNWRIIRLFDVLLRPLWTKVFSGVDVREEDLERIRSAMRDGTPVLVPCHKSHFDYILVTWVLYNHDMTVPHVVAGMNLAVWPISTVLRWCGGFFIERSFGDDPVFPAVFGRYLREMVRQEYPMEFFIEGGRTRSGKLMSPRLGVLGMVLDAAEVRPSGREVTLLPVALAYEQVAEERVYAAELGGEPKRAESFGELLRARSVFKRRYGRVYLRVGEPVSCSELVDGTDDTPAWSDRTDDQQKDTLAQLGDRIVHRIGASMVVLPTSLVALAALAHHRRALSDAELRARIGRFHAFLDRAGLPMAASLDVVEQGVAQALDRFVSEGRLRPLEHEGARVWDVPPTERITLDFYKNQVLHAFVEAGTVAAALRARADGPHDPAELEDDVRALRRVWRREFVWDPDSDVSTAVERGLTDLVVHGALSEDGGSYRVVDPVRIGEVHALFRPLLEAYLLVARRAARASGDQPRSAFVDKLQAEQDDLLVAGSVSRPESISKVNLQNAVGAFTDLGALEKTGAGDRKDPVLRADREALTAIADTLAPMVGG